MVMLLPKAETFASQLGSSLSRGMGNAVSSYRDALKEKREGQDRAGQTAVNLAQQLDKDLTLEDIEEIYSSGSKLYQRNQHPADAYSNQAKAAVDRKNKLRNIKENIAPDTLWRKITHPFESAEDREFKNKELEAQTKEFSKSKKRDLYRDKFGAETIEDKASPLSKETFELNNSFPNLVPDNKRKDWLSLKEDVAKIGEWLNGHPMNEPQKEYLSNHLAELFKKDPNANPLLIRRDLENKGVGWRDYRDILDNLQETGQIDLSQNKDYEYVKSYLSKPPLGPLDKVLNNMKIITR